MRCGQGTPASLPAGYPGSGALMDGAMQHAPQPGRQVPEGKLPPDGPVESRARSRQAAGASAAAGAGYTATRVFDRP